MFNYKARIDSTGFFLAVNQTGKKVASTAVSNAINNKVAKE
jgi:hypothetical protein